MPLAGVQRSHKIWAINECSGVSILNFFLCFCSVDSTIILHVRLVAPKNCMNFEKLTPSDQTQIRRIPKFWDSETSSCGTVSYIKYKQMTRINRTIDWTHLLLECCFMLICSQELQKTFLKKEKLRNLPLRDPFEAFRLHRAPMFTFYLTRPFWRAPSSFWTNPPDPPTALYSKTGWA